MDLSMTKEQIFGSSLTSLVKCRRSVEIKVHNRMSVWSNMGNEEVFAKKKMMIIDDMMLPLESGMCIISLR